MSFEAPATPIKDTKSAIDKLSGFVIKLGKELGIIDADPSVVVECAGKSMTDSDRIVTKYPDAVKINADQLPKGAYHTSEDYYHPREGWYAVYKIDRKNGTSKYYLVHEEQK